MLAANQWLPDADVGAWASEAVAFSARVGIDRRPLWHGQWADPVTGDFRRGTLPGFDHSGRSDAPCDPADSVSAGGIGDSGSSGVELGRRAVRRAPTGGGA